MGQLNFELIKKVRESGKKYDRVIALSKGGLTWSRAFVDGLELDTLSSLRIKLYKNINQKHDEPEILEPLTVDISSKTVLLFDDVVDTGETYQFAKKYLLDQGAKEVVTAALFYKPNALIKPDFYAADTTAWIVFPHEIQEFVRETSTKWLEKGLAKEEVLERYKELGLPTDQVRYCLRELR